MKTKLLRLFAAFVTISGATQLHAQGSAFTYQGRLNGLSGPATGTYDFAFTVYDSSFAGNAVAGPVTNSTVSVSNGLFTTTIDAGSAVFNGSARWLEIAVRTNGSSTFFTLSPRQAFTPSPYSITAGSITGPVAATQINGTIPSSAVAGTYNNQVTLNNANNQFAGTFSGNGAGVTNVNAATLGGLASSNFWQTGGNNVSAGQFIGSANNQAVEIRANNQTAFLVSPALSDSPNIKGGAAINTIDTNVHGSVIAGGGSTNRFGVMSSNHISADYSFIGAGDGNWIQPNADHSAITSGYTNIIGNNANFSIIGGGQQNNIAAYAYDSTIGGGLQNQVTENYGAVAGGEQNSAFSPLSTVAGGYRNTAGVFGDYVGGGCAVGGGFQNTATGDGATVPGGEQNNAQGYVSFAAGYGAVAAHDGAFVWADSTRAGMTSTGNNQFLVKAAGGMGINTNNPSGNSLNVLGNVNATSFSGNGANITNLNAAQLTGTVASAQVSGTYASALTLNNANNSFTGNALTISGNKTGGWPSPVVYFNNTSTAANSSPALRVTAGGTTSDGALNVSATGTGLIARFGNAVAFVADITTNGTIDATAFSGNGSALTSLNASQISSGTLPNAQLSGTYSSALTLNSQSDNFTGNYTVSTNGNLRLNDRPLYFRGSGDANHGLAYNGAGITNFGTGNVQVDGPVLWGFSGGSLGVLNGGAHSALTWTSSSVNVSSNATIGGNLTVNGNITADNMPGVSYMQNSSAIINWFANTAGPIVSVTNTVSTPGYLVVNGYVAFSGGTNAQVTAYLDVPGQSVSSPGATTTANPYGTVSISWVTPVNPTGTSNYVHSLGVYVLGSNVQVVGYSLNAVYVPRLTN